LHAGVLLEDRAQLLLRGALIDVGIGFEFDMKLAAMRSPGILAQLGAPNLLLDALHVGQRQHLGTHAPTHREHLLERGAGDRARGLDHEVPFAKIRHESAAEQGQRRQGADHERDQDRDRELEVPASGLDSALLP
jgi:hypothetical protein